jgi:hypothetical protein
VTLQARVAGLDLINVGRNDLARRFVLMGSPRRREWPLFADIVEKVSARLM